MSSRHRRPYLQCMKRRWRKFDALALRRIHNSSHSTSPGLPALHLQEGDACMTLMAVIDYALIVLFFVLLAGLLLLVTRSSPRAAEEKTSPTSVALSSPQRNKISYGVVAVLLLLPTLPTFLFETGPSRPSASRAL